MFATVESLAAKRRAVDALEAEWLVQVAEYDRSHDWTLDGSLSAAASIRAACRMDHGVANHYVDPARKLAKLPLVCAAYLDGDISQRHVQVLANAYTDKRAAALADVETQLVDVAREYTPKELAAVVRALTDAIDGDDGATTDENDFDARALYLSESLHGRYDLRGTFATLTGQVLAAAIDAER